mmetsp:Transcript_672/g.1758  ORF Transcript_672/g.1758 Transcript_672/m.1758 type:complete len:124 (+) Transcript_672:29-400(+)
MQKLISLIDFPDFKKPERSAEELEAAQARAKEFSRAKMRMHREVQKDLKVKRQLMLDALAAMPEDLRKLAMEPDYAPLPLNRWLPTDTAPFEMMGEERAAEVADASPQDSIFKKKRKKRQKRQ